MECRFPVGEVDGITIAVLLTETEDQHVGLLLFPAPADEALDPTRNLYYTSWTFTVPNGSRVTMKLALLGSDLYNLRFRGKPIHASWKTIYIRTRCDGPSDRSDVAWTIFKTPSLPAAFRLSRAAISGTAAMELTLRSGQLRCQDSESQPQVWHVFFFPETAEQLEIMAGTCVASDNRRIWAYVMMWHSETWGLWEDHSGHNCATDHIADWPHRTRVFGDKHEERRLTLWFTDCPHAPGAVVFHLHLGGRIYEEMMREANVTFPSPPSLVMPTPAVEKQANYPPPRTLPPSAETRALHELVSDNSDDYSAELPLVSRLYRTGAMPKPLTSSVH